MVEGRAYKRIMILLIFYFSIAIIVSFLCSILEASFLSHSPVYIESIRKKNPKVYKLLKYQKDNLSKSLSSILILNTISHTVGAAGVGAQAATIWGEAYMFVISSVLTLGILIFSEIIPKTLGAHFYKKLSGFTAYSLKILIFITYPLIKVTSMIDAIMPKSREEVITKNDLISTAILSEDAGGINEKESDLIENTLTLSEIKLSEIQTPRSVIYSLDIDMELPAILDESDVFKYSRIPVYKKEKENIVGFILTKDLFRKVNSEKLNDIRLDEIVNDVTRLNENIPVSKALDLFITKKEHLFLVEDSYGQLEGIVTLEDCIETILGVEIVDESDDHEDMQKYAKIEMKKARKEVEKKG